MCGLVFQRIICQESEEDIERVVEQAKQKCKCPIIYAPVCGSDNVTYQNRCILDCAANHKLKYQGKCEKHGAALC